MIFIKNNNDIENIKKACEIWKKTKKEIINFAKIGTNLLDIENLAKEIIEKNNAKCAFKDYNGFKGYICISVNETIIHGVPKSYTIKKGDIISFDIGVDYNSYICDAAFTIEFDCDELTSKMNKICYNSLLEGIKFATKEYRIGDISFAIQKYVEENGFEVIKNFGGHGCGIKLHEDPIILNYGKPGTGPKLKEGMIICIEPMVMIDSDKYEISKNDNWSVNSINKKNTSHWEHMILITENGNEILTKD